MIIDTEGLGMAHTLNKGAGQDSPAIANAVSNSFAPSWGSEMCELYAALSLAQSEMETATKDSENPQFKSKYASLSSIREAIRPVQAKNGLCIIQYTQEREDGTYLVSRLAHKSGGHMESEIKLRFGRAGDTMQGLGSAMTYAQRYALASMFGVALDDDDGNDAVAAQVAVRHAEPVRSVASGNNYPTHTHAAPVPVTRPQAALDRSQEQFAAQQRAVASLGQRLGIPLDALLAHAGVNALESATPAQLAQLIQDMQRGNVVYAK